MLSGQAPEVQVFSAFSCRCPLAPAAPEGTPYPPHCWPTLVSRGSRLFPEWGCPSASSSQAPFLGTREPSDLGWAGFGPAGVDFGSGVGFPE